MNLPNKLSLLRVCCIPLIVLFLYLTAPWCRWVALFLFALASFTDYLDGHIARSRQLITDFGKFIDPVADKLLVLSTMIMLVHLRQLSAWMVVVILARELGVDGLRLVAVTQGKVIAAGKSGKVKTVSQMVLILALLIFPISWTAHPALLILGIWVVAITLYSGGEYFLRNRDVLFPK